MASVAENVVADVETVSEYLSGDTVVVGSDVVEPSAVDIVVVDDFPGSKAYSFLKNHYHFYFLWVRSGYIYSYFSCKTFEICMGAFFCAEIYNYFLGTCTFLC